MQHDGHRRLARLCTVVPVEALPQDEDMVDTL